MKDLFTSLSAKNGYAEEKYVQDVREKARELYPCKADELAILRKEISYLRDAFEKHLGITLDDSEFVEYNNSIEACKAEAKTARMEAELWL